MLDHLDKKIIISKLNNKNIEIDIFKIINSTNHYLESFITQKNIRICLSEQQTAGKGRLNREWHSPSGCNIYFSCLYYFNKNIAELSGLSLMVSLAVCKTLQPYLTKSLKVKWPNDIFYDGKKLAGILVETQAQIHHSCAVIIGIGINVNMNDDKENKISQEWTSLKCITSKSFDRNILCASLTNLLLDYLKNFEIHGFNFFQSEWNVVDYLFNQKITVNNTTGIAKGINEEGCLLLQTDDGSTKTFSSGDTSLTSSVHNCLS